ERLFACRKCRMDRFEDLVKSASGEKMLNPTSISPSVHSTHQPSKIIHSSTISRALSEYRLIAELSLRGIVMEDFDASGDYNIVPCTYQHMNEATKILIPGLFEFCRVTFPDFQLLSISDKWLLIRNYEKTFHSIDGIMRKLRRLGKNSSIFFSTFTTYLSEDLANLFFSDCPDKTHAAEAAKTLHDWIAEFTPILRKQIDRIDPTDQEFTAMIGLALWSVENVDPSDQLLAMAARYRADIIEELAKEYRQTIGQEELASRIGVILCLLQEIRVS
ncbi:hypothetical protein PENTCL1PPCAC_24330, partial [Pristionchus entomophagus]